MLTKQILRKNALDRRKNYDTNSIKLHSSSIISKILNSADFKNAKNIALYYPINNEIDITPITKVLNKNFYFPRCHNNNLEFVKFQGFVSMKKGAYNIPEPSGSAINPSILDIIYIPALCANTKNYRLGYGMGYYDRFFTQNKLKAKKIIVLSSEFINDEFMEDKTDYPCDMVLSEN